jgi:methyl-accepting chemotaxis protein
MVKAIYTSLEKHIFNTLTRKIVGNILFLVATTGVLCVYGAKTDRLLMMSPVVVGVSVLAIFFLRYLILTPVKDITMRLEAFKTGRVDLSKTIAVQSYDELLTLAQAYNGFLQFLSGIIEKVQTVANNMNGSVVLLSNKTAITVKDSNDLMTVSNQIATASEEMSQTIASVAQNTTRTAELAVLANDLAGQGADTVQKAVAAVRGVGESNEDLAESMSELNANANGISEIVAVIKDIADQTNLLALNAAIEAARAGERGRGFAVVADEVRKLAEKTINETAGIENNIRKVLDSSHRTMSSMDVSIARTRDASSCMSAVSDALGSIMDAVNSVRTEMNQISLSISEQSSASDQISIHAVSCKQFADNTASISKESRSQVQLLRTEAKEIQEMVDGIKTANTKIILLEKAKTDHKSFVARVQNHLLGADNLDTKILGDYRNSGFGAWYYTEGKAAYGSLPGFNSIEAAHKRLHEKAVEAVNLYNGQKLAPAEAAFEQVKGLSVSIISMADALRSSNVDHRGE